MGTPANKPAITASQRKWRAFMIIVGGIVFVAYSLPGALKGWLKQDLAGVPLQHGTATVVEALPPNQPMLPGDTKKPTPIVLVRFHGQICTVGTVLHWRMLQAGKPASIDYRIGHSGRIYIEKAEPVSP